MPYGRRGIDGSSAQTAENDTQYFEYQYSGTSGALTIGMPLYADVTDAGEFNALLAATALTPATPRTCGRATVGTDAKVGPNPVPVGIFDPHDQNPNLTPNNGDVVRVCASGRCIAAVTSPTGSATAIAVGGALIASTTQNTAAPGARTSGINIGVIVATRAALVVGAQIAAAGGNVATLVNAMISLA